MDDSTSVVQCLSFYLGCGGWQARTQGQWQFGARAGSRPWSGQVSCCLSLGLRTEAIRPPLLEIIGLKRNFPSLAGGLPTSQDSERFMFLGNVVNFKTSGLSYTRPRFKQEPGMAGLSHPPPRLDSCKEPEQKVSALLRSQT